MCAFGRGLAIDNPRKSRDPIKMKHVSLWRGGPWGIVFVLVLGWLMASPALADEPPSAPSASVAAPGSALPAPAPAPLPPSPASSSSPPTPLPAWEKIGDSDGII